MSGHVCTNCGYNCTDENAIRCPHCHAGIKFTESERDPNFGVVRGATELKELPAEDENTGTSEIALPAEQV